MLYHVKKKDLPSGLRQAAEALAGHKLMEADMLRIETIHAAGNKPEPVEDAAFGSWQKAGIASDGLAYERSIREEWERR